MQKMIIFVVFSFCPWYLLEFGLRDGKELNLPQTEKVTTRKLEVFLLSV